MLRKNREHRYGSAGMLVTDMDAFLNSARPPHSRSLWESMKAQFNETDWT